MPRSGKWVLLGVGVVLSLGVGYDVVRANFIAPPDTRTPEQRAAAAKIDEITRATGGHLDKLNLSQWKMYDEWRRTGVITGLPYDPRSGIEPGKLTKEDLERDEKLHQIFLKCRGDFRKLTKEEGLYIRPYVDSHYPLRR